jgi:uncharacterized membrane protein YfcA
MTFIEAIPLSTVLAFSGIAIIAAMVHGAIGIGFPLIATPLLAMITDVRTAILLLVLPTMVVNVVNILKGGRWHRSIALYWPLAAYGMIGSFIGTRMLIVFPPELFRPLLAAMLILYLNTERIGVGFAWIHQRPRLAMAVFGMAAGILGGTVNVMLPALIIFALEMRMPKTVSIQVFNFCFLFGKLTQGAVLVHAGFMTTDILRISIPLAILGLVFIFLGLRIRERIPAETYRRWLRYLLVIMAGVLLVQFFRAG